MKAVVDDEGRVKIPPDIREATGIVPGTTLDVRVRDGVIEFEPESVPYRLVKKGYLTVLEPTVPVPPLPEDFVETLLDEMRREREGLD